MVEIQPEVIDIASLGKTPVITLSKSNTGPDDNMLHEVTKSKPSVNFGGGIELLMNDKRKSDGSKDPTSDIDLGDLTELENELMISLLTLSIQIQEVLQNQDYSIKLLITRVV